MGSAELSIRLVAAASCATKPATEPDANAWLPAAPRFLSNSLSKWFWVLFDEPCGPNVSSLSSPSARMAPASSESGSCSPLSPASAASIATLPLLPASARPARMLANTPSGPSCGDWAALAPASPVPERSFTMSLKSYLDEIFIQSLCLLSVLQLPLLFQ